MFKVGEDVHFLVEHDNTEITLEDGKLISHDEGTVCILTQLGAVGEHIKFLPKDSVFDNVDEAIERHAQVMEELIAARRNIKHCHISYFKNKS